MCIKIKNFCIKLVKKTIIRGKIGPLQVTGTIFFHRQSYQGFSGHVSSNAFATSKRLLSVPPPLITLSPKTLVTTGNFQAETVPTASL